MPKSSPSLPTTNSYSTLGYWLSGKASSYSSIKRYNELHSTHYNSNNKLTLFTPFESLTEAALNATVDPILNTLCCANRFMEVVGSIFKTLSIMGTPECEGVFNAINIVKR